MILAIDPGVKACGAALFHGQELFFATYKPATELTPWVAAKMQLMIDVTRLRGGNPAEVYVDEAIIEMPRIYPGSGQQKGDLNDLLNLATVVGQLEARLSLYRQTKRIFPAQWKGQVKKEIMTRRIEGRLTLSEQHVLEECGCIKSKRHNVLDAVGIGLHRLGRL